MAEAFGADRPAAVCRELTKTHEEVRRGPLADLVAWAADGVRGEVTIVVAGARRTAASHRTRRRCSPRSPRRRPAGSTRKEAIADVARAAGVPKREVYDLVHQRPEHADAEQLDRPLDRPTRRRAATEETSPARGATRSGRRAPEPLPHPVVDNHCHLDIADGDWLATEAALARAAEVGVAADRADRLRPARARGGPSRPRRRTTRWSPASRCTPTRRRGRPTPAPSTRRWPRSRRWPGPTTRCARSGRPASTTSAPARTGREAQEHSFRAHIDLAKRLDKTLVIHDRDAHDDVLRVIDEEGAPERWVMHCFSGDAAFARACLDRGAYLSFAGTVTFKNAAPLRNALAVTPLDRVLVETDAPYLTPMPYRGRPNASYLVPHTVRAMAEVLRRRPGEPLPGHRRQHRAGLRRAPGSRTGFDRVWSFEFALTPDRPLSSCDCWPGSGPDLPPAHGLTGAYEAPRESARHTPP